LPASRDHLALSCLLFVIFAVRAVRPDQPIVENYVGRQVPTAMVARNLERGSGFLRPTLDTGPFPNLFLVEPPIFAEAAVLVRGLTGLELPAAGRLVSAFATALGGWGIFGLVRPRGGLAAALGSVVAFGAFPVTIRYGRAFQPDMLMIGTQAAALRCWDEHEQGRGPATLAVGWLLLATSLATKITSAAVLLPLLLLLRPIRPWKLALAVSAAVPALCWYGHAAVLVSGERGSRASLDNARLWFHALVPTALLRGETYLRAARSLLVRAFTPVGTVVAGWGLLLLHKSGNATRAIRDGSSPPRPDHFAVAYALASAAGLAILAGKLHHEYYWLALAPPAAIGAGTALANLGRQRRALAIAVWLGLLAMAGSQTASTWRTPPEWADLPGASETVRAAVPPGALLIAPEALLFAADRRGCRLEFGEGPSARAAGEWGGTLSGVGPLALVEFYRARGARFVADVGPEAGDPLRRAWREAVRRRFAVVRDRPGVFLADLEGVPDAPP